MLLALIKVKDLQSSFPKAFYERGLGYFREQRVKHLEYFKQHKKEMIRAIVQGGKAYEVRVELRQAANRVHIFGKCNCPVGSNCKHVIAVLLKALHRSSSKNSSAKQLESKILRDPQVEAWLQDFTEIYHTVKKTVLVEQDHAYSLHYLLSGDKQHVSSLKLKLVLAKVQQSGILNAFDHFKISTELFHKFFKKNDLSILKKLAVDEKNHSPYHPQNTYTLDDIDEEIFKEIINTGRCHWEHVNNPPLCFADSVAAEFFWEMNEEAVQKLCFSKNSALCAFYIKHFWYYDEENSWIGMLDTEISMQSIPLLLQASIITAEQSKKMKEMLQKMNLPGLPMPVAFTKIDYVAEDPVPQLNLFEAQIAMITDKKKTHQVASQLRAVATLYFDYHGEQFAWNDPRQVMNQVQYTKLRRIVRNLKKEAAAVAQLLSYGAILIDYMPRPEKDIQELNHHFLIDEEINPLEFNLKVVPLLHQAGWRISTAAEYPYQISEDPIDEWYTSVDEHPASAWFGLELGIIFKGEKINLLPVLRQLLDGNHLLKENKLNATEVLVVQLRDGRFIKLPAQRVKDILNVLIELHHHEYLKKDEKLYLNNLQAARLIELEHSFGAAQLRWFGGERLRDFARKIKNFTGMLQVAVPIEFNGQLRPYQLEGLSWLQFLREYHLGGILADDMGLGKTVQALSHILLEKKSGRLIAPCLVVAPTSLMFNWRMEAARFAPHLRVLSLHGAERGKYYDQMAEYDLVITTYSLLVRDKKCLLKNNFYQLILDEAQNIKNSKSLAAQIAVQLPAQHRLCLTGTPLENHLGELWSLFHFLMPGLLDEEKIFNRLFRIPIEKQGNEARREQLNRRIAPFILRRTKDKVLKELPPKVEMITPVELVGSQRDLYEVMRIGMQKKLKNEINKIGLARSHIYILDAILKLRQICCDPRLLKMEQAREARASSAKLELLMNLIPDLLEEGRRILLFSQFTEMLGLIEDQLNSRGIPYLKLTGKTKDRETPVRLFQQNQVSLFLISLKAGGTGLNLTAADTVIHYDPWWNPAVENQATDRAHRIGQEKTVFVYKLVAKGTVEEKLLELQARKASLLSGLFSEKTRDKLSLTEADLNELFDPINGEK